VSLTVTSGNERAVRLYEGWIQYDQKNSPQGFGPGTPGENLASESAVEMPFRPIEHGRERRYKTVGIVVAGFVEAPFLSGLYDPSA